MTRRILPELINALLLIMWVYAAASKLFAYEDFRFQLISHKLIKNYASIVAWLVPAIELIIAFLLVVPALRKQGYYLSIMLLLLFSGYIIYMFNYYPHRPCSCGGIISRLSWRQHLVFNAFFILLSVAGLRMNRKSEAPAQSRQDC
ncbi:MAG: MauE/DoxX family redox-associated membrane protein [Bacteroidota bacterium]